MKKTLQEIWWDHPDVSKFASVAKSWGYTYDDCRRFIWTAAGLEKLAEIKENVWK